MVGGTVIEIITTGDRLWINCQDKGDECAILVRRCHKAQSVSEGDTIWWQGGAAYWTPKFNRIPRPKDSALAQKAGQHYDIRLERIGCSGVARPSPNAKKI